jgi:hypothetical protein
VPTRAIPLGTVCEWKSTIILVLPCRPDRTDL